MTRRPDLAALIAAGDRLAPPRLRELIGASSIADIRPGQHVERPIQVLFTDIQGYTALSENQTPAATFDFINEYLGVMEPVVHRNGGVVDKFIGDAIMALFPHDADDAVHCAVELASALASFNAPRVAAGHAPIQIGIGINGGIVSIGTIGTLRRLETTVIGDAVNLAARLEATTRAYGAQILVSESVLYALNDPFAESTRFIDRLRVKGKLRPVSIYEVFSHEDLAVNAHKLASRPDFERAVAYYHTMHCEEARLILARLCAACPEDRPARVYLERCTEFLGGGPHHGTGELSVVVAWRQDYDVGESKIDAQHFEWCRRLNDFIRELQSGKQDGIVEVFQYLRSYIELHFADEEALMDEHAYPFARQHKIEHARYADMLGRFVGELAGGSHDPLLLAFRANLFLIDWFINHTTGTDRHLGAFLSGAGAERPSSA